MPFQSQIILLVFVASLNLIVVTARTDFSQFFGKNINKGQAWGKLLEMEGCPRPELWDGTIIMVNESLAAGATFISDPNVTSRYECEFECCYKQDHGCNIAIYTDAQRHCYLFACGQPSKCKFDQHKGYTVSSLSHAIVSSKESTAGSTTKPTTTQTSTTPAPSKQQHLLDGCRPAIDSCVTENTECSPTGFCTCKKGFHPKNGVCRHDCLDGLQFECTNGDSKFGSPDCVAVYDVCDGTPQCPDGSDEKNCDEDKFDWSKLADVPSLRATLEEYLKKHGKGEATTAKAVTTGVDVGAILSGGKVNPQDDHEHQLNGLRSSSTTERSEPSPTIEPSTSKANDLPVEHPSNSSAVSNDKAVVDNAHVDLDSSARSAVVALSLTLTLTLVLIVYLVCRYKKMRRRISRHGKPLNGTEVDYLIDGMYL